MIRKATKPSIDKEKAESLIVYICHKMRDCDGFGATLNSKALYYIDHVNYLKFGKKLTGMRYVKQKFGPTPKPQDFLPIKEKLIHEGKLEERECEYFGKLQKKLLALADPDVSCFSGEEIALIDTIIERLLPYNGKTISDVSHQELSWKVADSMEELPEYAFLFTESSLTDEDLAWARRVIDEQSPSKVH